MLCDRDKIECKEGYKSIEANSVRGLSRKVCLGRLVATLHTKCKER